jgi:hypothetical protein
MKRAAISAPVVDPAPTHPGWLFVAPDHRPYAWYAYDRELSYDVVSAAARFEPDADYRDEMLNNGWKVRSGRGIELVCSPGELTKESA